MSILTAKGFFADKVEPFEYEPGFKVIKVNSWGYVRFQNFQLYLSETFINDYVQFGPNPNNDSFLVCYRNFVIAEYDPIIRQAYSPQDFKIVNLYTMSLHRWLPCCT